jgi:hypothetical protein
MNLPGGREGVIKSTVFDDSNGAIATSTAIKMMPHAKHIAVKYHFFKSYLKHENGGHGGKFSLLRVDTTKQTKADTFTKGLALLTLQKIWKPLCGW